MKSVPLYSIMLLRFAVLILFILGLCTLGSTQSRQKFDASDLSVRFSINVYKKLVEVNGPTENFMFSPFSIQVLLLALADGASGPTANELYRVLGIDSFGSGIHKMVTEHLSGLQHQINQLNDVYTLISSNKMYVNKDTNVKQEYNNTVKRNFDVEFEKEDFSKSVAAAKCINEWVNCSTKGLIDNIIGPDELKEDTKLVLINALYLAASWSQPFDERSTTLQTFHNSKQMTVQVPTMSAPVNIFVTRKEDLKSTILELPCYSQNGPNISMVIVLPDDTEGLSNLEQNILSVITTPLNRSSASSLVLSMPKFDVDTMSNFKNILQKMRVTTAFGKSADFSKMTNWAQLLYISSMKQKTILKVMESGIEAAAVSVAVQSTRMLVINRIAVDHPFLFYIQWNNAIMFLGRVAHL